MKRLAGFVILFAAAPLFAVAINITLVSGMVFPVATQGDAAYVLAPNSTSGAAVMQVTGDPNAAYSISNLPNNNAISNGTGSINTTTYTTSPSGSGTLDGTGQQMIYIGCTRAALTATQSTGTYTGTYTIRVKYTSGGGGGQRDNTGTISQVVNVTLTLTKNSDLVFGQGAQGDPASTVLPAAGAAASFTVSGQASTAYTVTLPADGTVTMTTGAGATANDQIAVTGFTSSPSGTGLLSAAGSQTLYVGATRAALLNTQTAGAYTGSFTVTVAY